jgi:hypothetical protein
VSDRGEERVLPARGFRGSRDTLTAVLLAFLGIAVRLAFVRAFPTVPTSDCQMLVAFGRVFHDRGLFPNTTYWIHFSPGLPMMLSLFDGLFPRDIAGAARTATAAAMGFLGVLPFLIWRPVLAFRWRLLAGLLLTLWPGQVFISGVVTQDNWALLPSIALCALAVRRLRNGADSGHPVAAALLVVAAAAIRQEMLIVLAPPWLAASVGPSRSRRLLLRRLALASSLTVIGVLALAAQRYASTGRFTITSEHGGFSLLGSVAPGSFSNGWKSPRDYISQVEPALFGNPVRLRRDAYRLAWEEARRHPLFHAIRVVAQVPRLALVADADNLRWSVDLPGGLPEALRARGESFRKRWDPWLRVELGLIQGLFLASVLLGLWRRDRGVLVIAAAVFLKVGVHILVAPVGRLVLPAIAFELLTIPLAAAALASVPPRRLAVLAAIVVAVPILLLSLVPPLEASIMRFQQDAPKLTRFALAIGGGGSVDCTLESGKLICLDPAEARLETPDPDPSPGDTARVVCRLPALPDGELLTLRLEDTYALGGLPDRMIARVLVDDRPILRHDIAGEAGGGWFDVPLSAAGLPAPSTVTIEEVAVRADPGSYWGASAPLGFAFRR